MFTYRKMGPTKRRAKSLAEALMTNTCDLHRPSGSLSPSSVYDESMTVIATGVSCRIVRAGGSRRGSHAVNPAGEDEWVFHLPVGTDVRLGDLALVDGVRYLLHTDTTRHKEDPFELRFIASSASYDGYPAHV